MTKPKYQIGDRVPGSPFYVRGVAVTSSGDVRYFIQVMEGENTFVVDDEQLVNAIELVRDTVYQFKLKQ